MVGSGAYGSRQRSATALARPMVDPPPTARHPSGRARRTASSAAATASTGTCRRAPSKVATAPAAISSAAARPRGVLSTSTRRIPSRASWAPASRREPGPATTRVGSGGTTKTALQPLTPAAAPPRPGRARSIEACRYGYSQRQPVRRGRVRVVHPGEVADQARLHREDRVRVQFAPATKRWVVSGAKPAAVTRKWTCAGRYREPPGRQQQPADQTAVGGDRVGAGHDGGEPEPGPPPSAVNRPRPLPGGCRSGSWTS